MALQLRRRKRKKLHRPKLAMDIPEATNRRWSMDFLHRLSCGRRIKILNIVDDYSREVVGQLTGFPLPAITGAQVARFLDRINRTRGLPDAIVCDNGPEFTGKAMFFWGKRRAVKLNFIQPGKPTQNAFVESLNGKFRNECLSQNWFRSIGEARAIISDWRRHYNHVRPHSSLNYQTPVAYANQAA